MLKIPPRIPLYYHQLLSFVKRITCEFHPKRIIPKISLDMFRIPVWNCKCVQFFPSEFLVWFKRFTSGCSEFRTIKKRNSVNFFRQRKINIRIVIDNVCPCGCSKGSSQNIAVKACDSRKKICDRVVYFVRSETRAKKRASHDM